MKGICKVIAPFVVASGMTQACSEDTIINVDNSTNTIQYVNPEQPDTTSKEINDTINVFDLYSETQALKELLSEQWKNIESLEIDNQNLKRENDKNNQTIEELKNKLDYIEDKDENPEKMTDVDIQAFAWARRYGIYEVDFTNIDNNIAWNDPITKHMLINILYKYVSKFDIASYAWKNSGEANERATWEDFGERMLEYGQWDEKFKNFFSEWRFQRSDCISLSCVLKNLKAFTEYAGFEVEEEMENIEEDED